MHFNHYGGSAARLATALVNFSVGVSPPRAADPDRLWSLLTDHDIQTDTPTASQAAELVAWAGELSQAYGEPDLDRQVAVINHLLERGASRPFISQHGGRAPHLHYFREEPDVVVRVRAQTAAGLAHTLCDAGGTRLGRCARDGCAMVFLDTSRNGQRRFCSLRCANRVRVADHRRRTHLT
ncbi:CGNR zinc finger domain-containing protein [Actinopolymorpha alba]|uniref:CGNR zinc finger domain-containing protein n=1 Tax=Actinopolymorpha alba TaxID=533267 RepID=UPI00036C45E5|nr:CGNR zinc finger domain-containing protein [Actinopolymorpha alba]